MNVKEMWFSLHKNRVIAYANLEIIIAAVVMNALVLIGLTYWVVPLGMGWIIYNFLFIKYLLIKIVGDSNER